MSVTIEPMIAMVGGMGIRGACFVWLGPTERLYSASGYTAIIINSPVVIGEVVSRRASRYNPCMFKSIRNTLQELWRGFMNIGAGPSLHTVLYPLRLSWYRARFDRGPNGEVFVRTRVQATRNLTQLLMTHKAIDTKLENIGDVIATRRLPHGIELQCSNGLCIIEAITWRIMRVRVVREAPMPSYFSYATVLESQDAPLEIREDENGLTLATSDVRCHVRRSPFGLRMADAQGRDVMGGIGTIGWTQNGGRLEQSIAPEIQYYGLGERAVRFPSRGHHFQLTTIDQESYRQGDDPLYINIPFLVGLHDANAFGILFDSTYNGELDLGSRQPDLLSYQIDGPELRFDFILGPTLPAVVEQYTSLTGRMPLPPRWTLGYQQSRWSYETAGIIRKLAHEFRQRQIPCDAIHFDIDYMDGFRCFTWDRTAFPDPPGLIDELHQQGFKAVGMIDPGIKTDPNYHICADGIEQDVFVKLPDGSLFHGPVWPGECYFPDFTNPRVREWWGKKYQPLLEDGFDGFWNDMNEPTIFGKQTFPETVQYDLEGHGGDHRQAQSAYGMQMVRATYEGLNRLRPNHRNWVFTRSGYAGVQRYASSWTADNYSTWEHLALTPAMLLNLGLSGLAFTGADVGGFSEAPTPELFARWISMGSFTPFFRTHSAKHTPDQEPWSYGSEVESIARTYIGWRYRLLEYIYTAFWQSSQQGTPIMRPLLFEDPANPAYKALDDQWLFGDHLLISPVLTPDTDSRQIHIPPGQWYDFWTDEPVIGPTVITRSAPLDVVPIHVRAGAVLPLGPVRQHNDEAFAGPLELHAYAGNGESWLYEDDGATLAYRTGAYRLTHFRLRQEAGKLLLTRTVEGDFKPLYDGYRIMMHGGRGKEFYIDGAPVL